MVFGVSVYCRGRVILTFGNFYFVAEKVRTIVVALSLGCGHSAIGRVDCVPRKMVPTNN